MVRVAIASPLGTEDAPDTVEPSPFALYIHWPFCKSKCPY
jgi:coproporphyrinogen III oxidase-like Fe-S oxidoreductase